MINLLMRFTGHPAAGGAGPAAAEEFSGSGTIGYVVLAVIVGPVVILTLAAMLGVPRTFRIPGLFVGSFVLMVGGIIIGLAVAGLLLGFLIPG